MSEPMIWNKNRDHVPADAVYVGRPSRWGNPFKMEREADRDRVCDAFEKYAIERVRQEPSWLEPLTDKDLVCWCAPKRCHAETLRRLANAPLSTADSR
jgi:hypothetical protein